MTKEDWKALSKKQQWDAIVALRGPDIKRSEVIKIFTTGVIRQSMSNLMRVGGQLSSIGFVVLPNGAVFTQDGKTGLRPDLDHFVTHTWEAADIIGVPVVHVPPTTWEKMVIAKNEQEAMTTFLNFIKSESSSVAKHIYKKYIEGLVNSYGPYLDPDGGE